MLLKRELSDAFTYKSLIVVDKHRSRCVTDCHTACKVHVLPLSHLCELPRGDEHEQCGGRGPVITVYN